MAQEPPRRVTLALLLTEEGNPTKITSGRPGDSLLSKRDYALLSSGAREVQTSQGVYILESDRTRCLNSQQADMYFLRGKWEGPSSCNARILKYSLSQ